MTHSYAQISHAGPKSGERSTTQLSHTTPRGPPPQVYQKRSSLRRLFGSSLVSDLPGRTPVRRIAVDGEGGVRPQSTDDAGHRRRTGTLVGPPPPSPGAKPLGVGRPNASLDPGSRPPWSNLADFAHIEISRGHSVAVMYTLILMTLRGERRGGTHPSEVPLRFRAFGRQDPF